MLVLILDTYNAIGVLYDSISIYSKKWLQFIREMLEFINGYDIFYHCDGAQVEGTLECQRHCADFTCQVNRLELIGHVI